MDRFDTRLADGTLYLETPNGDVAVGEMADVVDMLGETYTLEYDEDQQAAVWLQTDPDGTITFDVRETILELDFDETFVKRIASSPLDVETPDGYPQRTQDFAERLREIWDSKGNVER